MLNFVPPQSRYEMGIKENVPVVRLLAYQLGKRGILVGERAADSKHGGGKLHALGGKQEPFVTELATLYTEAEEELGIPRNQIIICSEPTFRNRAGRYPTKYYKAVILSDVQITLNSENAGVEFITSPLKLLTRAVAFRNRGPLLEFLWEYMVMNARLSKSPTLQEQIAFQLFKRIRAYDAGVNEYALTAWLSHTDMDYQDYLELLESDSEIDNYSPQQAQVTGKGNGLYRLIWLGLANTVFQMVINGYGVLDDVFKEEQIVLASLGHLTFSDLIRWLEAIERHYPGFTGIEFDEG